MEMTQTNLTGKLEPIPARPTALQSLEKLRAKTRKAEERVAISEAAKMKGTFVGEIARTVRSIDRMDKEWPNTQDKPEVIGLFRAALVSILMGAK